MSLRLRAYLTALLALASPNLLSSDTNRRIVIVRESAQPRQPGPALERLELGTIEHAERIAAGRRGQHILVLTGDGVVWAWGLNDQGQLGTGTRNPHLDWTKVTGVDQVAQVAAGAQHSVALRNDGTVWTWGGNLSGELGDGTLLSRSTPARIEGLDGISAVSAGSDFTLALRTDGVVFAWGANWLGVVPGSGARVVGRPAAIPGLQDVARIAVVADRCYAQDRDGRWWTWGGFGQFGQDLASGAGRHSPRLILSDSGASRSLWPDGSLPPAQSAGDRANSLSLIPWTTPLLGDLALRLANGAVEVWGAPRAISEDPYLLRRFPVKGEVVDLQAGSAIAWIEQLHLAKSADSGAPPPEQPELGPPPAAPPITKFKQRLSEAEPQASGDWFNTTSKSDVRTFFNTVYLPALSVAMNWTGSVVTGDPGTTSQSYKNGVAAIINWYRGMAGVPMGVTLDPVYSAKDQQAALMFAANKALSHNPPTSWLWYTAEGAEAAGKSNICYWSSGMPTGCVDSYMRDDGSNNTAVGHRRWILYPQTRVMGTGDTSSTALNPSTNALWVFDGNYGKTRPLTRDAFVTWPSAGYFPYSLVPARWSFSYPGASFAASTVTVTRDGASLTPTLVPVTNGYGENTLVWTLAGWNSGRPTADSVVSVTVGNVMINNAPQSFTYQVIVFDPSGSAPSAPSSPSPANGAAGVTKAPTLTWTGGSGATSHDVYFGPTSNPPLVLNTSSASYAPGTLSAGSTYYWKVVARSEGGSATSPLWSFTTMPAPSVPVLTSPANGATAISASPTLSWGAASNAASYDVYFGTAASPPLLANTTGTTRAPGPLAAGTRYYWKIAAKNLNGTAASATWSFTTAATAPPTPSGLRFVAVTPCRVVDTRNQPGALGGPFMTANSTRSFPLPQSACGIPATAKAYSLNVTVVPRGPLSYLTMWPTGVAQPYVSTLNSPAGDVVANAAIVPAGTAGAVSAFVTDNTDLILDINGYFQADTGSAFYASTPCRVADTRNATGPFGGPVMGGGASRSFTIPSGSCSIPATATAYAMNVTVVPAGGLAYLTTWPAGQSRPVVSTLNSYRGKIVANAALVPAGSGGAVSTFVTDQTHVILDINGHFAPAGGTGALSFYPVTPCRVSDTRGANGSFGGPILSGGSSRSIPVPQSTCGIPATAKAYSVNVTVVPSGGLDYLTAWPAGKTMPVVSTLNSYDGAIVANAAIIPAGTNGNINFFATNSTHLIVDINGYFQ